jgi:hypothetical protein
MLAGSAVDVNNPLATLRASLRQNGMVPFSLLPGTYFLARKRASETYRATIIRPAYAGLHFLANTKRWIGGFRECP